VNRKNLRSFGNYAGLGIQLGATIIAFCFLGYWLDGLFGTRPVLMLLGTFVGAAAAFYSMYRKVFPEDGEKEE
jgi:F0F1-type ATP synthase assembly protein I